MAGWWEWGKYKQDRSAAKALKGKKTREYAEKLIAWDLPDKLQPISCRKCVPKYGGKAWYVWSTRFQDVGNGNGFIYVLLEENTNKVRYVGITEDPPRRMLEHRKNNILTGEFRMKVYELGHKEAENYWIKYYRDQGCLLLNKKNS